MRRNKEESEEYKAAKARWEAKTKAEREEAQNRIGELTSKAMDLINEATDIADESGVYFYFDITHGMGGSYCPSSKLNPRDYGDNEDGWCPSSKSC